MSVVPGAAAVAAGVRVSRLWGAGYAVASVSWAFDLPVVQAGGVSHGGDDLRKDAIAVDYVVCGGVVRHQPEDWRERVGALAGPGAG